MEMKDKKFIQNFMKLTNDAWIKGWHERNGGDISYRLKKEEVEEIRGIIDESREYTSIGVTVKNLANEYFLITGSGKFIRNVAVDIEANVGIIKIDETGTKYKIVWGLINGAKPSSELHSHLMSQSVKYEVTNGKYRVIMHSHATNTIALTFVLPLDGAVFTRELWEMATECPVVFPSGIGVVPWMVPGGVAIGKLTSELMRKHDVVVWAHHGVLCAGEDLDLTFCLMDTVEKSAEILVKVLSMGGKKQTITSDNFRDLARDFNVTISEEYLK